jgi:hypothetical protein
LSKEKNFEPEKKHLSKEKDFKQKKDVLSSFACERVYGFVNKDFCARWRLENVVERCAVLTRVDEVALVVASIGVVSATARQRPDRRRRDQRNQT